ncbi:MAG: sulfotransferase [Chlorobiales bacterium]|nr:sulfotransferase [Chlorobiales bacterium]
MNCSPVIIIGAPRSGTNILRDVLLQVPGFGSWPCDEINYIWRYGNASYPTDELLPENVTPVVSRYIRNSFSRLAERKKLSTVIEKTCANSLRVAFVDKIMPEARYVFIYRDGIDVAGSALKRWNAKMNVSYLARKARYVPLSDIPFYTGRYLYSRTYRLFSGENRLAFWGPHFEGMDNALRNYSLVEVCALQWKRCLELSEKAFADMENDRVIKVRYEDLVTEPVKELRRIIGCLQPGTREAIIQSAAGNLKDSSVGKGRMFLPPEDYDKVRLLINDTLTRYGYP